MLKISTQQTDNYVYKINISGTITESTSLSVGIDLGYIQSGAESVDTVMPGKSATEGNTVMEDSIGKEIIVPKGYTISEDSPTEVDKGIIIKDNSENEWVWIPVPSIDNIYGKLSNNNFAGKLYTFANATSPLNWSETNGVMSISSTTGNREPAFLSDATRADTSSNNNVGLTQTTIQNELDTVINSIQGYGGFYIGRYELTGTIESPTEKSGVPINSTNWYNLYSSCKNLTGGNTSVTTGMIWGMQWDAVVSWLISSGNKTYAEITNSTSWGNYYNSSVIASDNTTILKPASQSLLLNTGITSYTKANNIYDLAGNVAEWTMEASGTSYRVYRAGSFDSMGSSYAARRRDGAYPNTTSSNRGTRAMLIIN